MDMALEIHTMRNERMKLYNSCKKYCKQTDIEMPTVIFNTDWVGKFIRRAGFVLRTGDILERDRGVSCTASTLIRWGLQFGNLLETYTKRGEMLFNFAEAMLNVVGTKPKLITKPKFKKPNYEETPDVLLMIAEFLHHC